MFAAGSLGVFAAGSLGVFAAGSLGVLTPPPGCGRKQLAALLCEEAGGGGSSMVLVQSNFELGRALQFLYRFSFVGCFRD